MLTIKNKSTLFALIALLGLVAITLHAAELTASESVSVTESIETSSPDEEEFEDEDLAVQDGGYSLEDQLADLLMIHQDTRWECLQSKQMIDEAESNGEEVDPSLQQEYDDCMATLGQINDDMAALSEQIYEEELDSPFTAEDEELYEEEDVGPVESEAPLSEPEPTVPDQ